MKTDLALAHETASSRALECSPVRFIPQLLEAYLQGGLNRKQLIAQYWSKTRDAQFYFLHFPKEEIQSNQRVFKREFAFADALSHLFETGNALDDDALRRAIRERMEAYLASLDEPSES